jgi:DNA sulfur modification protein DndD
VKIQSIELENYRQYRDKAIVELSCDSERNINVIQGVNGAGKTNMLNAIDWCLYGVEEHLEKYSGKKQPIINDAVLKELKNGQRTYAKVSLKMISSDGRLHVFERQINARKDKDARLYFDQESDFHVFMQIERDMHEIPEKEFLINRILPNGVKNFFIFDGEKLDEFFKEEKSAKVRDAIFDVSQLSLLDKAVDHLEKSITPMRNELNGESPQIDQINEAIREIEKGRDSCKEEKKGREEELEKIRGEINKIADKLKSCSEPLVKELQKQRERLQSELERLEISKNEANNQASEKVILIGPWIYAITAIHNTLDQIAQKTKKGELPPKMKETFAKELLDKGECICGTDISEERGRAARQKVINLLNEVRISAISEDLTSLKYDLNPMLKEAYDFIENQDASRKKIAELDQQFHDAQNELREIGTRLEGINVEDVANLEIVRNRLDKDEERLVGDIRLLEEKIKNARLRIEGFQRNLSRELEKSKKYKVANEKLKLASETLAVFNQVKQRLIDDIRNTIQEKTKNYFLSLIWKKETYVDVKIDEDYNISVINNVGSECLGTLSAGERQVLALSFLAALREVSGFDAPVVIDTPLGRISGEPKENIAELLPEFLKEAQVTLFMTDEEYTPKVRQKLARKVGREYELDYDEGKSQTKVKPYGTK